MSNFSVDKIILISIFLSFFLKAQSQDSVKLFYISKIVAGEKDSLRLTQCDHILYRGALVKVLFFRNEITVDSLFKSVSGWTKWKDSVILNIDISQQIYNKSDSIVIIPTHQFLCKTRGVRGSLPLNLEGEEKRIRNIKIKFISNPTSAVVYLVPKVIWERNPQLIAKNENALNQYKIANGITPVWSPVQEYVYIALFKYNGKYIDMQCSPTHKNPIDSVYADFIRR